MSPLGIAFAVWPLVMAEHELAHRTQEGQALHDFRAQLGMGADFAQQLRRGHGVFVGEHLVGKTYLADVVQDAGDAHFFHPRRLQTHPAGQGGRQASHPLAVALGVGVPRPQGSGHGPHRGQGPLFQVVVGRAKLIGQSLQAVFAGLHLDHHQTHGLGDGPDLLGLIVAGEGHYVVRIIALGYLVD